MRQTSFVWCCQKAPYMLQPMIAPDITNSFDWREYRLFTEI